MSQPRIAVVGAGNVGAAVAQQVLDRGLGDAVLLDVVEGLPQGKALDLSESAPAAGFGGGAEGSCDWGLLKDSAMVVITAGATRKPGMSRDDLLAINAGIVKPVAERVRDLAPGAFVLVVTNPLDVMTWLAWKVTGFPRARVFGMAGVLDASRLAYFISRELGVSPRDVSAMVLGGHGDSMVPLPRYTTVSGIPVTDLLPASTIDKLVQRTRDGGAEIVSLLKQGSAYYAPAASAAVMIESVLRDGKRLLPAAAVLDGEYRERDVCLGVPVVLGSGGVERIIELGLDGSESAALAGSAEAVRSGINTLKERGIL
jgi:malate dehydrogenase